MTQSRLFCIGWVVFNVVATFVYGYAHQGGLVPALTHMQQVFDHPSNDNIDIHLVVFRTYMPPRHLLMAPIQLSHKKRKQKSDHPESDPYQRMYEDDFDSFEPSKKPSERRQSDTNPRRYVYDLTSSANRDQLETLLVREIKPTCEQRNCAIFLLAPSALDFELTRSQANDECPLHARPLSTRNSRRLRYEYAARFPVHVTFEHLDAHLRSFSCAPDGEERTEEHDEIETANRDCFFKKCLDSSLFQRLLASFSLNLYQIVL